MCCDFERGDIQRMEWMIVLTKTFCITILNTNNTKGSDQLIISINDASDIPIYLQIRNQIVQGISDGRLEPGEHLPTVRALAEEIGINTMTVSKSYQILKQEGYIYTDRRNGACVKNDFVQKEGLSLENREQLKKIIAEAKISGMTKEAFLKECETYYEGKNTE